MNIKTIFIKNMVCNRCVMVVESIFKSNKIEPVSVTLGEVRLLAEVSPDVLSSINEELQKKGFQIIDDKKGLLLERIKALIIDKIHHHDHFELKINWSHFLQEALDVDYNYISTLFSSVTGITLEQYIIKQKIEKAKEYLFYNELSIKEIAYTLGYSSVAHLSSQFKKITGLTPSEFKTSRDTTSRQSLDQV